MSTSHTSAGALDSSFIVCDSSGQVVLTYPSNAKLSGSNFSGRADFQQALKTDGPVFLAAPAGSAASPDGSSSAAVSFATRITDNAHPVGVIITTLPLTYFTSQFMAIQQQVTTSNEVSIWLLDQHGRPLAGTDLHRKVFPDLEQSSAGNQAVQEQDDAWSYSFIAITGTPWKVVVARPLAVILAPVISLQHSLTLALIILVVGASLFWFVMHGWVVAPLSRLAHVVTMIKPDQTEKMTEHKLLIKERNRVDVIGQLIAAFATMEDEMHALFRKSDETSQARLHTLDAIMQSMNEGVLLESPEGQVVYANRSFTQFVGASEQDFHLDIPADNQLAEKLQAMLENPDTYQEALSQAEQAGGSRVVAFQVRGYYNQVGQLMPAKRDIRMQHFEVRDRSGQLIGQGKIFNDVTRQNEAEQMKKNLLAIVSHELRTPLTAIKGFATSLLETDVEFDPAVQERFLRRIVEEGDRMADLVTNLLEMSQLEAGTLKLSPALYPLATLLPPCVQDEQQLIHVDIPADLPLLYVDRRRIEMVLRNLVENARCHAGEQAAIEIVARHQADDGLYLSVADNGPGLPQDLTERIFEHFYQIDGGRERCKGGVGLGLAICRGFIEAHGGRIWAENRTDGTTGAVFHIWLPAKVLRAPVSQHSRLELRSAL
jgi:signal transduction histidine kinase